VEHVGLAVLKALGHVLFVLSQVGGVALAAVTLPGSVLVLLGAVVFSAANGWHRPGWQVLILLAVLATIAELLDNVLSMYGVKRYGGSGRSAVLGGLGALAGAIIGGIVIPIFIVGSLIGAFAAGFAVAYWLEMKAGKEKGEAMRAGWGAIVGRVMGATAKVIITMVMAVVAVVGAYSG
jgi:hypothetical protein